MIERNYWYYKGAFYSHDGCGKAAVITSLQLHDNSWLCDVEIPGGFESPVPWLIRYDGKMFGTQGQIGIAGARWAREVLFAQCMDESEGAFFNLVALENKDGDHVAMVQPLTTCLASPPPMAIEWHGRMFFMRDSQHYVECSWVDAAAKVGSIRKLEQSEPESV